MRIVKNTHLLLALRGRRSGGEVGEKGLWLPMLVSIIFLATGGFLVTLPERYELDLQAWISIGIGIGLVGFSLSRSCLREQLILDLEANRGTYATRIWPAGWASKFAFGFDDVSALELRYELQSPGGAKTTSRGYPTWEVLLAVKPRRRCSLGRFGSPQEARVIAEAVACAAGCTLDDRTPKDSHRMEEELGEV